MPAPGELARWQAFLIGVGVLVLSSLLCIANPLFGLAGFVGAVASLFFKGYRYIFVGYVALLGILLLGLIIWCAYNPLHID